MTFVNKLKYHIEYTAFKTIGFIARMLPLELASALSGKGWRLIAPWTPRHKRAIDHLRRAFPEKSDAECDAIARAMWETLGRIFSEMFHLDEIYNGDRFETSQVTAAFATIPAGTGNVVCAAHQGNWEIAVMGAMRNGVVAGGIYQRLGNPLVDAMVKAIREPFYPGGLYEKGAASALPLIRHVRQGGCLALMADLRDSSGVKVPFFGQPAPSTRFPAMVARSVGAPLFACAIIRAPGVRFRAEMIEVVVPYTDDKEADIVAATANLQAAFERTIRARPEQWMWAHRRWG